MDHGQQLLLRRSGRRGCAALLHLLGRNGSRGPRRVGLFHLFIVSCILWWYPWPELTRKWLGGALSDVEYQDAKAEFNAKIAAIEQEQRLLESDRAALECLLVLANCSRWTSRKRGGWRLPISGNGFKICYSKTVWTTRLNAEF